MRFFKMKQGNKTAFPCYFKNVLVRQMVNLKKWFKNLGGLAWV